LTDSDKVQERWNGYVEDLYDKITIHKKMINTYKQTEDVKRTTDTFQ